MSRPIGPGPGKYMLPSTIGYKKHDLRKTRKPEYSFGRRPTVTYVSEGPGSGKYNLEKLTRYGKKSYPTYMGKLLKPPPIEDTPGPGDYVKVDVYRRKAPKFHMGKKFEVNFKEQKPAPNIYKLPESFGSKRSNVYKTKSPGYSMLFRHPELSKDEGPGPAKYAIKFKDHKIGITLKSRCDGVPADVTPAPNAYNKLQNYKPGNRCPKYSFGIRHAEYAPPMIIEGDNC